MVGARAHDRKANAPPDLAPQFDDHQRAGAKSRDGETLAGVQAAVKAYMHKDGCGGPAFLYDDAAEPGALVMASRAKNIDGSTPEAEKPIVCGTCGERLPRHLRSAWLEDWPKELANPAG